jgi:hypothetical protein
MNNHDEIKKLLSASRIMLSNPTLNESIDEIRKKYHILSESETDINDDNISTKINVANSVENEISDDDVKSKNDKTQAYRISGGIIVLHGKQTNDVELTTDEKLAFQETMDEFVNEVSDMVDFNKLNIYPDNVEWSGKIIDYDLDFFFSIGENNGIYINGDMIKADDNFLEQITKLKNFYNKFKSKWSKIIGNRKLTK